MKIAVQCLILKYNIVYTSTEGFNEFVAFRL